MNNFILKIFKWVDGELTTTQHEIESIAEAIEHAIRCGAHGFKIYDKSGNLHHSQNYPIDNSYA